MPMSEKQQVETIFKDHPELIGPVLRKIVNLAARGEIKLGTDDGASAMRDIALKSGKRDLTMRQRQYMAAMIAKKCPGAALKIMTEAAEAEEATDTNDVDSAPAPIRDDNQQHQQWGIF